MHDLCCILLQKTKQQSHITYDDLAHWMPKAPIPLLLLLFPLNRTNDRICAKEDLRCGQEIDNNSHETIVAAVIVFSSLNNYHSPLTAH